MSTTTPPSTRAPKKSKIVVWTVLAAVILAAIVGYVLARGSSGTATASATTDGQVVRENSRVLSQAPDEKAVLVEFLDFECESCRAAYPFVEELRGKHSENFTFVHRYFPLPGHRNSMNAAVVVEAAAEQGAYEPMYKRMFETQAQWGESAENKSAVFRTFAEDLGLDLAAYDHAVADPSVRARVEADVADGKALGVTGTPTFFLDGKMLEVQS
ncbi:MAG: DsbA family protein, partial [Acidimicrobiales bacterium]